MEGIAMARTADGAMWATEKLGLGSSADELHLDDLMPEFSEEEERLNGGAHGVMASERYIPIEEFPDNFADFEEEPEESLSLDRISVDSAHEICTLDSAEEDDLAALAQCAPFVTADIEKALRVASPRQLVICRHLSGAAVCL